MLRDEDSLSSKLATSSLERSEAAVEKLRKAKRARKIGVG